MILALFSDFNDSVILNNIACTNLVWSSVDFIAPTKCSLSGAESIVLGTVWGLNLPELRTSQRKVMFYLIFNIFLGRLCVPFSVTGYDISLTWVWFACLFLDSCRKAIQCQSIHTPLPWCTLDWLFYSFPLMAVSSERICQLIMRQKICTPLGQHSNFKDPHNLKHLALQRSEMELEFLNSSGHFSAQILHSWHQFFSKVLLSATPTKHTLKSISQFVDGENCISPHIVTDCCAQQKKDCFLLKHMCVARYLV